MGFPPVFVRDRGAFRRELEIFFESVGGRGGGFSSSQRSCPFGLPHGPPPSLSPGLVREALLFSPRLRTFLRIPAAIRPGVFSRDGALLFSPSPLGRRSAPLLFPGVPGSSFFLGLRSGSGTTDFFSAREPPVFCGPEVFVLRVLVVLFFLLFSLSGWRMERLLTFYLTRSGTAPAPGFYVSPSNGSPLHFGSFFPARISANGRLPSPPFAFLRFFRG